MQRIVHTTEDTIRRDFPPATLSTSLKPCFDKKHPGLWYSIGNEWEELCLHSTPFFESKLAPHRFAVELDESRILKIQTPEESSNFIRRYALDGTEWKINWPEVAKEWAGIEVVNPVSLWDKNPNPESWPYSWDVSGGCVWDSSAVLGLTRLEDHTRSEKTPAAIITGVERVCDKAESLSR